MRLVPRYSVLLLLIWFVGCADSKPQEQALLGPTPTPTPTPTPIPNPPPPNPQPAPSMAETMNRLVTAYEQMNLDSYRSMFTNDFTYEFSTNTNPALVQQF